MSGRLAAKPTLEFDMKTAFGVGTPDAARFKTALSAAYRKMMIDDYAHEYRTVLLQLVAGDVPLIVHCSAGKDQTGIGSAVETPPIRCSLVVFDIHNFLRTRVEVSVEDGSYTTGFLDAA